MPTYEYQCKTCGHRFEKFQSIKAAPIKTCPSCGKNTAQRLISAGAGIIFRGSGFYITDYRDSSYKEKAQAESAASKPAEGGAAASTTSGDSKHAADAAPKADTKTPAKSESKPAPRAEAKPPAKSKK